MNEYSVVTGTGRTINGALVELMREVAERMRQGRQPLGGALFCGRNISAQYGATDYVFAQTLVNLAASGEPQAGKE